MTKKGDMQFSTSKISTKGITLTTSEQLTILSVLENDSLL